MPTTAESFFEAILAEPDDDALRLIFADWLEENDQPRRAEFIRVGIALAKIGLYDCPMPVLPGRRRAHWSRERMRCGRCRFCKPQQRLQELMDAGHHTLGLGYRFPFACTVERGYPWAGNGPLFYFRRGFVAEVRTRTDNWLEMAPHYARATPLERVWLVDRSPAHRGLSRAWYRIEPGAELHTDGAAHPYLPEEIYGFLEGGLRSGPNGTCTEYPADWESEALTAACMQYARLFLDPALEFDYLADGVHVRLHHPQLPSALPSAPSYTFVGIWPTTAEARTGFARWHLANRDFICRP